MIEANNPTRVISEDNPQYDLGFNMGLIIAKTELAKAITKALEEI